MPNIAINVTGPSNVSRSRSLSGQRTYNFYTEKQDETGELSDYVLHSFWGLKLFGTTSGVDRGHFEHNNVLYRVVGVVLYSVDQFGVHTTLTGTVAGNAQCFFTPFNSDFIITTGGVAYQYVVSTDTLSTISDVDLETPNGAAFLNNQMIYDGDNARFGVSDVGDPTSIDGLNYATAESNSDDLMIPYVFDQSLYLMGTRTIETWWNSGVGSPPFDRIEGGIMPIGLGARASVSNNDKFMYLLSDDGRVYRVQGTGYQIVSSIALSHAIDQYNTISDARGFTFTAEGQNFYWITFPRENETWLYSESAGDWTNLSSGVGTGRHIANSYAFVYRKHIISDFKNGDLFELDLNTFDENGSEIRRVRETGDITGAILGAPGKEVEMTRFELIIETGTTTLLTGQGSDPVVMLELSDDGGKTYDSVGWGDIGKMGDFIFKVEWFDLGSFYNRRFRIAVSDPIQIMIASASADVEVGI